MTRCFPRRVLDLGGHDDDVEGRLDGGLVPAGEGLPRVRGLELGDGGESVLALHCVLGPGNICGSNVISSYPLFVLSILFIF